MKSIQTPLKGILVNLSVHNGTIVGTVVYETDKLNLSGEYLKTHYYHILRQFDDIHSENRFSGYSKDEKLNQLLANKTFIWNYTETESIISDIEGWYKQLISYISEIVKVEDSLIEVLCKLPDSI